MLLPAAAQKMMPAFPAAWMAAVSVELYPPPPKEALMATMFTPRVAIRAAYWSASISAEVRMLLPSLDTRSAMMLAW